MRLLIAFIFIFLFLLLRGSRDSCKGPNLSGRMDTCRNKEKGKERRQGKQKEEEDDCFTNSPPFARVGAAL